MNYKKMVKEDPLTLTILPTHKCTASCKNCCFGCNPKVSHIMPYEEMVYHIDEAVKHFSTLSVLVISGGESDIINRLQFYYKKGLIYHSNDFKEIVSVINSDKITSN